MLIVGKEQSIPDLLEDLLLTREGICEDPDHIQDRVLLGVNGCCPGKCERGLDCMLLAELCSTLISCLGKDLSLQALLQAAVTDEDKAELVGDAQDVEDQAKLVLALPETFLIVIHELEDVPGDIAHEPAVVQPV